MSWIAVSVFCALAGFVWSSILIAPFGPFDWLMLRITNSKLPERLKHLIGCGKCVSGQLCLWGFWFWVDSYTVIYHIFAILLSVALAAFLTKIHDRI